MRWFILSSLLVCFQYILVGQPGLYREYSPATTANTGFGAYRHPQRIIAQGAHGYLIRGWDHIIGFESAGGNSSYVIKTDTAFVPQWRKEYSGAIALPTGGVILFGENTIEKVSANGTQVWIKSLPDSLCLCDAILSGNKIRFVGTTRHYQYIQSFNNVNINASGFTIQTDTNGNYLTSSVHRSTSIVSNYLLSYYAECDFSRVKRDPAGNFYLLSQSNPKLINDPKMCFIKMDSSMNFIYGKTWSNTTCKLFLNDVAFLSNGKTIGVGITNSGSLNNAFNVTLLKMDAQGSIIDQKVLPNKTQISDLHLKQNGHYVVGVNRDDSCFLMEFDTALVITWCKYLGLGKNNGGVIEKNQLLYYTTYKNGPLLRSYNLSGQSCSSYSIQCSTLNSSITLTSFSLVAGSFTPSLSNITRDTSYAVTYTNTCFCNAIVPTLTAINCVNTTVSATGIGNGAISWYSQATGGNYIKGGPTFTYTSLTPTTLTIYLQDSTCTLNPTRIPITFSISGYPQLVYSPANTTLCQGSPLLLNLYGADSYYWHHNQSTQSQQTLSPSVTTIYTITATNSPTCSVTSTISVVVTPTPNVVVTPPTLVCTHSVVSIVASGASSYTWSNGATGPSLSLIPTTTVPLQYTVSGANGLCSKQKTITIQPVKTPTLTIQTSAPFDCINTLQTLSGLGATNYSWSTGQLTSTLAFQPQAINMFTLTGWNQQCFSKKTYSSAGIPVPTIQITPNNTLQCIGSVINLHAQGAGGYSWVNGPLGSVYSITVNAGTNIYTVNGYNNTCTSSKSLAILGVPIPTLSVVQSGVPLCVGSPFTLTASGASNYLWSNGDTNSVIVLTPTSNVNLSITGKNAQCQSTQILNLNVYPQPLLTISGNSVICLGESLTLTGSGATSYQWQNGSLDSSIVINPSISSSITLLGTSSYGCKAQVAFSYVVNLCEGLDEAKNNQPFKIYPNPTAGPLLILNKNLGETLELTLYTTTGQLLETITISDQRKLDLSSLASGIYLLYCRQSGQTFKLIKTDD